MILGVAVPERTHALLVGVERYEVNSHWNLNGPASDARRLADWLLQSGVPAAQILLHISALGGNLEAGAQPAAPASRDAIRGSFRRLQAQQADLLLIYWGGHGVVNLGGSRRLFYSNATEADKQNLVLEDLLQSLLTTYFSGFPRQIVIVDACANFVEHLSLGYSLPDDTLPKGERLFPEPEQFVLLSARAGESAKNLAQERAGQFSDVLLELLRQQPGPLDMGSLANAIRERFRDLHSRGETAQTPIYWWRRDWNGDLEELGESLDLIAASIERTAPFGAKRRAEIENIARPLVSEEVIKRFYIQSLPGRHLFNPAAASMRHVLIELDNLTPQEGSACRFPLLGFVERLALHIEREYQADALGLRGCVDRAAVHLGVSPQDVHALRRGLCVVAEAGIGPFHLLVEVVPDRLDSKKFSLEISSWAKVRGFEPIDLVPEKSGSLLLSDIEILLVQLIEETVPDLLPEGTTHLVLELFLPRELLCWNFDQLRIGPGKQLRPVGVLHRVIVRWRDRARRKSWDLAWKRKWLSVKNGAALPESIFWIRATAQYRPEELFVRLTGPGDPSCLGLGFSPAAISDSEDILDTILDSGVPVAFWLRHSWLDPDEIKQAIDQMCRGEKVSDLPEAVWRARRDAFTLEEERHVGSHLTLLWDDPDRRLPASGQSPLAHPRIEGGQP